MEGGEDTTVVIVKMLECIVRVSMTVELLYLGHTGTDLFVHCREVVHTSEVKMYKHHRNVYFQTLFP